MHYHIIKSTAADDSMIALSSYQLEYNLFTTTYDGRIMIVINCFTSFDKSLMKSGIAEACQVPLSDHEKTRI